MGVIKDDNQQQSNVEKKIHKPQEILKGEFQEVFLIPSYLRRVSSLLKGLVR